MIPGFFSVCIQDNRFFARNLTIVLALGKRACRQYPAVHQAFTRRIYELELIRP